MSIRKPPSPKNPALRQHAKERTQHAENGSPTRSRSSRARWQMVQDEEQQNEQLLRLSNEILELTRTIHTTTSAQTASDPVTAGAALAQRPGQSE